MKKTLSHWKAGGRREDLSYFDVEDALSLRAFNKIGQDTVSYTKKGDFYSQK